MIILSLTLLSLSACASTNLRASNKEIDAFQAQATDLKDTHPQEAANWLQKIIRYRPKDTPSRIELAKLLEQQDQKPAAAKLYKQGLEIELEQNNEQAYTELAEGLILNLIAQSKYEEALRQAQQGKEHYPDNKNIERNLRIILALMQSYGHSAPQPMRRPSANTSTEQDKRTVNQTSKAEVLSSPEESPSASASSSEIESPVTEP